MKHARLITHTHFGRQGGYIALVSVLIASALMVLIGVGITFRGIDAGRLALGESESQRARLFAESCAEEALLKLKANLGYTGGELIMINGGDSCNILSVSGNGNTDRVIESVSTSGGYVRKLRVEVAEINPRIVIREWKLVADF